MKSAITLLALIPLAIAATFLPEPKLPYVGPRVPPAAQADTFKQRFEPVYPRHTFAERWWPGDGSFAPDPLTFEQRWAPVEQSWGRRVRTISITKPPDPPQEALEAIATAVPLPRERPSHETPLAKMPGSIRPKPRPIRVADICSKHGMHKVVTGKSWRCRR